MNGETYGRSGAPLVITHGYHCFDACNYYSRWGRGCARCVTNRAIIFFIATNGFILIFIIINLQKVTLNFSYKIIDLQKSIAHAVLSVK